MSQKYPGGFITKSPVAPTTTAASGVWTLDQQQQYQKAGTWPAPPNYIEEVFSTYLYTGNGSTQTITNGIDLSTKGGLVWTKARVTAGLGNELTDTVRGAGLRLISNTTGAQGGAGSSDTTGFTSSGFQLTFNNGLGNLTGENYVSWTFRKQPKFFDVVTYTGDGVAGRQIAHNLGSAPGCIIIKNYSGTDADVRVWGVWHRTLAEDYHLILNSTAAQTLNTSYPLFGKPAQQTSTYFTVGQSDATGVNATTNGTGLLYVAYLFAHDAGGFGLTGTDNVISCGSFTGSSTSADITLGYEPQWILYKQSNGVAQWNIVDNMRGMPSNPAAGNYAKGLYPNTSGAESDRDDIAPTATGFRTMGNSASNTYIYIAIRRGPMKTPTDPTKVFSIATAVSTNPAFVSNGVVDMGFNVDKSAAGIFFNQSRLDGANYLNTRATSADTSESSRTWDYMNGMISGQSTNTNNIGYMYSRAPGFFDVVCYTGTGSATTFSHNLGVAPELMIVKGRSGATGWVVYTASTGATKYMRLDNTNAAATLTAVWNDTSPTSSVFTVGSNSSVNTASATYVAYLFATLAGVSKVGSYTGTGATQTISCGFTGGARSVIIKRTDSTGDWYLWDTTRGMVSGTDPSLLMNSAAAEVNANSVYTTTGGFEIVSTAAGINASGGTYIFLAIA